MPRRTRYRLELTAAALRDFERALDWSAEHFGRAARQRYAKLIYQALEDIGNSPMRPSSRKLAESSLGATRAYHISLSREYVTGRRVGNPRHMLIYVFDASASQVKVIRILHDANAILDHLPE